MATTGRGGIMAPPNRCRIKGTLVSIESSPAFPNKQELRFALLESQALEGPDMAHARIGTTVEGFTFESLSGLHQDDVFLAEAEYIGDARRGLFQLSRLRPASD
ncbi:hypothetical protein [Halomonas cerina]|uniref:Uncharacterized protein n=1 Tax=Halomonas cerina TaxID=447424 RepID=A0A839VGP1_9GAMM|nr:hypothetical protein [Halomonas cerina]MBB3192489.1 hypothetical protein [Halomonas cerina]